MSKLYFESYQSINTLLKTLQYSSAYVLVDQNTKLHCYPLIAPFLPSHKLIEIKAGEVNKSIDSCIRIWEALSNDHADRQGLIINLGGGVITDIGGFCASTYKRGVQFINIPTTLLAQVDASAGGKTGIDFQQYKNQIGVFSEPEFVLIDNSFHRTLSNREKRSGFSEMLKHGLIADKDHWEALTHLDYEKIDLDTIKKSVAIKQAVVENDPTEKGHRKILNFGHTIGHAIESTLLGTENALLHGEAIAFGMLSEAFIAVKLNLLEEASFQQIQQVVEKYYGKLQIEKALRNKS
jgi:3-dehydroquinate synthase